MGRLDRRGRDPHPGDLRNLQTATIANRTIVPNRPKGVFRTGKQDIAMNRAYQAFGNQKTMQQFVNRYLNGGGVSELFGSNPKIEDAGGVDLPQEWIDEILRVFEGFPDPLSIPELEAIAIFVARMLAAGNWDLMLGFGAYNLYSSNNASTNWKTGVALTPSSGIHQPGIGYNLLEFSGTRIEADFLASDAPLNDVLLGTFIKEINPATMPPGTSAIGANLFADPYDASSIYMYIATNEVSFQVNSAFVSPAAPLYPAPIDQPVLLVAARENASEMNLYANGELIATEASPSTIAPELNLGVLGYNYQSFPTTPIGYICSEWIYSKAIGFDHVAFNNAIVELNYNLDEGKPPPPELTIISAPITKTVEGIVEVSGWFIDGTFANIEIFFDALPFPFGITHTAVGGETAESMAANLAANADDVNFSATADGTQVKILIAASSTYDTANITKTSIS